MKKIIRLVLSIAIITSCIINFTACDNGKSGKILIDGKTYTVNIIEILHYEGNNTSIELHLEKPLVEKFQDSSKAPFWLGIVNNGNFIPATGRTILKEGIIFLIETPQKLDKIAIYNTEEKSFVEFDGTTHKVLPASSIEELENMISARNPELCKKVDKYQVLSPENNKAGISFEIVRTRIATNTFGLIRYSNTKIKSNEKLANDFTTHFFAVDADNPEKSLNIHLRAGRSTDNTEFFGSVLFGGDTDAKYALIGFEGLSKEISSEFETPSLFFIVELGDKYQESNETYRSIKSYCKTLYLAGDIFKNLKTETEN